MGLSLGVTPLLGAVSRLILILLMFFGRVGGLTLIFAVLPGTLFQRPKSSRRGKLQWCFYGAIVMRSFLLIGLEDLGGILR